MAAYKTEIQKKFVENGRVVVEFYVLKDNVRMKTPYDDEQLFSIGLDSDVQADLESALTTFLTQLKAEDEANLTAPATITDQEVAD